MTPASLSVIARRLNFIREHGANDGAWVNFVQRFTHNAAGDSWCASFVSLVVDIAYRGQSPLLRTASCALMLADAARKGYLVGDQPTVDDLYFFLDDKGHAHHVGIVSGLDPLAGIAGNTSADGKSSNGDGVYEHAITAKVFVRLPTGASA